MNFNDCAYCDGEGFCENADGLYTTCAVCNGDGKSPITKDYVEQTLEAQERLDERVSTIFAIWCNVKGIHQAYGVYKWDIVGDRLSVTQDTSCRGCFDTASHSLQSRWLWESDEQIKDEIAGITGKEAELKRQGAEAAKAARIVELERQLAELKGN